ncbi:putative Atrial natriuretic peptide receptor 3 [Hypsibius exemplaris]|uniref:Atrial natriuretic peptide receptor 3 n=1 Tax=Hypsibius exemplaris TaxID=2072580 RepID=A0A9X6NC75_HYPEX|nr:putative Atrial natriuretic peptide receptor 3 [Hypsibius exemplaris]
MGSDHLIGKWYYDRQRRPAAMTVFIFAGCLEAYPTNRLVAGWNTLMITSAVNGAILRNKVLSPTWITGSCVSLVNYLKLFANLFEHFDWKTLFLIVDSTANPVYLDLNPSLVSVIGKMKDSQLTSVKIDSNRGVDFAPILTHFRSASRVMIFLGHGQPLRQLMLKASELSMTNGEYAYIAMEIFESPLFGRFTWQYGDEDDQRAKEAFRSVLLLGPDVSIYDAPSVDLVDEWKRRSAVTFNVSYRDLNPYVMASYSSVIMFGNVLKETISGDPMFDLRDGAEFAKRFLNRTFKLDYTEVFIDEAGERRTDLAVRSINATTGKFTVRMVQDKARSRLKIVDKFDWPSEGNVPPRNEPLCGYQNYRAICRASGTSEVPAAVGATTSCIIIIALSFTWIVFHRGTGNQDTWWALETGEFGYPTRRFRSFS